MIWTWEQSLSTWMYGDENNGAGVYKNDGDDGYYVNVCYRNDTECIGPFDNLDQAKSEAEKHLQEMKGRLE